MNEVTVDKAELKTSHIAFEVKDLKEDGTFSGYGAIFGNVDLGGDICDEKCFDRSLKEHKAEDTVPGMYFSHDIKEPIGEWLSMEKRAKGLYGEGKLWIGKGIPKVEQAYLQMKSRGPKGLSIGYSTKKYSWDEKKQVRTLLDVDLLEVSPVAFPMNPKAKITGVKTLLTGKSVMTIREAEELLRDAGFSASDAKHFLSCIKAGYDVERDADNQIKLALKNLNTLLKG